MGIESGGAQRDALGVFRGHDHAEVGGLFARMAHLEHASVFAFEILHRELEALSADPALLA